MLGSQNVCHSVYIIKFPLANIESKRKVKDNKHFLNILTVCQIMLSYSKTLHTVCYHYFQNNNKCDTYYTLVCFKLI